MCIIANVPKGVGTINQSTLENMTNNNGHGFGVSYIEDDEIKVFKTMDSKEFVTRVMDIQKEHSKTSDILIHCRIATSGTTDINNCHPFHVNNETVFAHNGVLNCVEPTDKMSDTRMFNKVFLKNMQPNFLNVKRIREFIGEIIGSDKMVFQTVNAVLDKNTYIINKELGTEENGIWFSNTSYKTTRLVSNYVYDSYACEVIYEDEVRNIQQLGGEDYISYVEEFGSLADYIVMYNNVDSPFDELDDIIERANKVAGQIVMHTYDDDAISLFDKKNGYSRSKYVDDAIKALILKIIAPFDMNFDMKNATVDDIDKICWDCFGFGLPSIVTNTKIKV